MYRIKIDIPTLDKLLNINSGMKLQYENIDTGEMLSSCEPWNKGKTGLQESTRKGGNRKDLSPKMRKQIAKKITEYRTGKKHSADTIAKIRAGAIKRWSKSA